jgi:DNA processing protein
MVPNRDSAALVALLRSGRHPWQVYADMLEEAGSARAILAAFLGDQRVAPTLFEERSPDVAEAEAAVERWDRAGLRVVTVLDTEYPENLLAVHDRPPFLFVAGRLLPADTRSVAVIGSRRAGETSRRLAGIIARQLVAAGFTVVSGLAAGIDTAAHEAALAAGGRTIAVIGTGLQHSYPPQNADLQSRIAAECAVVSQFWPDTPPSRATFPMRNAVMSGISLASLIVDATHTSGARIQARLALAHGRPVLVMRHLMDQEWARELATRPGVKVVSEPEEVVPVVQRITSQTGPLEV